MKPSKSKISSAPVDYSLTVNWENVTFVSDVGGCTIHFIDGNCLKVNTLSFDKAVDMLTHHLYSRSVNPVTYTEWMRVANCRTQPCSI